LLSYLVHLKANDPGAKTDQKQQALDQETQYLDESKARVLSSDPQALTMVFQKR